jgi:primosomal protein N'
MAKVKLRCPDCEKGYRITTKKDGTTRCNFCGYAGNKDEFIVKEDK